MKQPTEKQQQQYRRFLEIFEQGKHCYLAAGGNAQHYRAGITDRDFLTAPERQEAKQILRALFVTQPS